jgi:hypothetical protein
MLRYEITISSEGAEIDVLLRGPGIEGDGRRYLFANIDRCALFVEAVNFAYRQGVSDGWRRGCEEEEGFLIVSGRRPEDLRLRRETWWEALSRNARRFSLSRRSA